MNVIFNKTTITSIFRLLLAAELTKNHKFLFYISGVSCDSCLKGNFRGRRYKCLVCYDYDLCAACYEAGATNTRHNTDHPMQCILTRADFGKFQGSHEKINRETKLLLPTYALVRCQTYREFPMQRRYYFFLVMYIIIVSWEIYLIRDA